MKTVTDSACYRLVPTMKERMQLHYRPLAKKFNDYVSKKKEDIRPANPLYMGYRERLKSFEDWPKRSPISANELAAAGFYYDGYADGIVDRTRCFYCNVGLCLWEENDDPFVEHTKYNSHCPFINSIKDFY